jgi:hypothetical protein
MKTEKERMLDALFSDEKRATVNVKFFLGDDRNISEEDLCREVNGALAQLALRETATVDTIDAGIQQVTLGAFQPG